MSTGDESDISRKLSEGRMPDGASSAEKESESIFSQRSGIRDPLVRQAGLTSEEASVSDFGEMPSGEMDTPGGEGGLEAEPGENAGQAVESSDERSVRRRRTKRRLRRQEEALEEETSSEMEQQRQLLKKRRRQKKFRVMLQRLRVLLKLVAVCGWMLLFWLWANSPVWTFDPPAFHLERNHLLRPEQVYPLVARWKGVPLYRLDAGELARDIKARFDVVDQVNVRRQLFPPRLDILLLEKKPWAELYADEQQPNPYALAVPGELLSLADYSYQPNLYLQDPPFKLIMPRGVRLTHAMLTQLREIGWQAGHIQDLRLLNVDMRNPRQIILNYAELPVILGKLNAGASIRLARLLPLLPKIRELREEISAVDLQWEEQVTFHRKQEREETPAELPLI